MISSYLTLFMRHEAKKVLFAFTAYYGNMSFQEGDTKLDLFKEGSRMEGTLKSF